MFVSIVDCKICGKEFYVKPSHQKLGYGKYCSIKCLTESQKKGHYVKCNECEIKTWKSPKDLIRSKSGLYFCSKRCQTLWRNSYYSGKNHANWKNGESTYRKALLKSEKERRCEKCGIEDIRILTAHHIDKNRNNNKIGNLQWLCMNCHHIEHKHN